MFFYVFGVGKEKTHEEVIRKQVILLLSDEMQSTEHMCSVMSRMSEHAQRESHHTAKDTEDT